MIGQPPISFGPSNQRLGRRAGFAYPRTEIEQTVIPAPAIENALFGVATKKLFGDYWLAVRSLSVEDSHLTQKRNQGRIVARRRRYVVGAPRVTSDGRLAAAGSAARSVLDFQ